jgi:hypothetical protein
MRRSRRQTRLRKPRWIDGLSNSVYECPRDPVAIMFDGLETIVVASHNTSDIRDNHYRGLVAEFLKTHIQDGSGRVESGPC